MRALIQRVTCGSVEIGGITVAEIGPGMVIFIGAGKNDSEEDVKYLAEKTVNLRIFEDCKDKMNRSLADVGGEALVVSQFTLYADSRNGRRPSFTDAAPPEEAERLYHSYVRMLGNLGVHVKTGVFGADMLVTIKNNGPVTIWLDTSTMMNKQHG